MTFARAVNSCARLLVGDQVELAVAEARLHVGQPVVLLGRRAQRLGEQLPVVELQRQLAAAGAEDGALGAEQVAEVEVEQRAQRLLAEHVHARVQLHAPGAVVEVEEGRLALAAAGVQAPGDAHAVVGLVACLERLVRRLGLGDRAHPRVGVGERLDAVLPERLELAPPGGEQLRGLFVAHA